MTITIITLMFAYFDLFIVVNCDGVFIMNASEMTTATGLWTKARPFKCMTTDRKDCKAREQKERRQMKKEVG